MRSDENIIKEITIFSIEGNKVFMFENELTNNKEIQLNLGLLNQGIYIIEIVNDKNQKYYNKIIKN